MVAKFAYDSWVDYPDTVITPRNEVTTMVAANVALTESSALWRSMLDGDGKTWVQFDFAAAKPVKVIAMQFRRTVTPEKTGKTLFYAPTDKLRIRLSNVSAGGVDVYDSGEFESGVLKQFGTFFLWLQQEYTARYMQIDFIATSQVPDGYIDVKRIWAGPTLEPKIGISFGVNHKWISAGKRLKPQRGTNSFAAYIEGQRQWSFVLGWLSDLTERDKFEDFEAYTTTMGEFLVHRSDLRAGGGDMFCTSDNTLGLTGDNLHKSSKSFLITENI